MRLSDGGDGERCGEPPVRMSSRCRCCAGGMFGPALQRHPRRSAGPTASHPGPTDPSRHPRPRTGHRVPWTITVGGTLRTSGAAADRRRNRSRPALVRLELFGAGRALRDASGRQGRPWADCDGGRRAVRTSGPDPDRRDPPVPRPAGRLRSERVSAPARDGPRPRDFRRPAGRLRACELDAPPKLGFVRILRTCPGLLRTDRRWSPPVGVADAPGRLVVKRRTREPG